MHCVFIYRFSLLKSLLYTFSAIFYGNIEVGVLTGSGKPIPGNRDFPDRPLAVVTK